MGFVYDRNLGKFVLKPRDTKATPPTLGPPAPTTTVPKASTTTTPRASTTTVTAPRATVTPTTASPKNTSPSTTQVTPPRITAGSVTDAQIAAMWQKMYDDAIEYKANNYGEDPPAGWWSARMAQIESIQKAVDKANQDAADKVKAETAANAAAAKSASAAAAAKLKAQQDELERQRKIKGSREAEAFLRQQADQTRASMLQRVAELYDPQKTATEAELTKVLQQANAAFDAAEGQVRAAGEDFTKSFTPSQAYSEIPLSTYTTAANPLLAALQQQGAGTGEVSAATEQANQFMAQQSALEKWAAGQLNVGQQNYDTAVQQAAKGGLAAALQGLAGRRADVASGINKQFADQLAQIEQARTGAQMDIDQKIQDIITEANKTRAETTFEYGNLPKKNEAAKAAAKKKKGAAAISGIIANIEGR